MKVIVHSYYRDPTEGLIVSLKSDLDGMFSLPSLGYQIQTFFDKGQEVSILVEIYDEMTHMNEYGLPDLNDYFYGKTMHPKLLDQHTPDLFQKAYG